MKKLMTAGLATLVFLLVATVAFANHSWNGYHWGSDNLSPTVKDKTKSSLYEVSAGVSEWAGLGTSITPEFTTAKKGNC